MKRQGVEGFTWDSDAEEWAAWAVSCLEHNSPRSWRERRNLARFANDMLDIRDGIATEARHKPAQRDLTPAPYSPPTRRKTPSYGAVIGLCVVVLAAIAFWIWG